LDLLLICFAKGLQHGIFVKIFLGLFEPLAEKRPKNAREQKNQKVVSWWVGGWVWDFANTQGGPVNGPLENVDPTR
jgi:hypothetical protein